MIAGLEACGWFVNVRERVGCRPVGVINEKL